MIQRLQLANMPRRRTMSVSQLLAGAVLSGSLVLSGWAQTGVAPSKRVLPAPLRASAFRSVDLPPHAKEFYLATLGVDSFALKTVESGLMIRFSYRVVYPEKAGVLNDKKISPYLFDQRTHRALVVPTLEKVGELRQSGMAEAGKIYWMLFSNKGDFVKAGSRASVVFGKYHVDGLVVQ